MSEADVEAPALNKSQVLEGLGAHEDTSIGEFPKCTEDDRACRKGFFAGCPSLVPFLALTLVNSVV